MSKYEGHTPDLLEVCELLVQLWDDNHPDDPCACVATDSSVGIAGAVCELCLARNLVADAPALAANTDRALRKLRYMREHTPSNLQSAELSDVIKILEGN